MIRPNLRDLTESNNDKKEENGSDADRAECKIQLLVMQNSCISTKTFEETWTIYSASKPV